MSSSAPDDLFRGVAATALLVNESRARRPDLSGDHLARHWIPDEHRTRVTALWDEFAEDVYTHDDLVCALRSRAVLELLADVRERRGAVDLVNVAAGFTSYPYLLPVRRAVEVDLPHVVAAKQARAAELVAAGDLPERSVARVAADVASADGRDTAVALLDDLPAPQDTVLVIEGLLYYLNADDARALLELVARRRLGGALVTFWPTGSGNHPVLQRQARWFSRRGVSGGTTFLDPAEVVRACGPDARHLDLVAQQARFGDAPPLPESELIPEHVVWSGL